MWENTKPALYQILEHVIEVDDWTSVISIYNLNCVPVFLKSIYLLEDLAASTEDLAERIMAISVCLEDHSAEKKQIPTLLTTGHCLLRDARLNLSRYRQ